MVVDSAKRQGAEFRFNTKAERLVREGGTVTGVIVSDAGGYRKINARKGVILATGGITDNREMLRCWCPAALRCDKFENFPAGSNNGDGILLGVWAGAAVTRCNPAPIIHPVNFSALGPGINTAGSPSTGRAPLFQREMAYEPIRRTRA